MVTSEPVDEIRGRDHSNEFPFLSVAVAATVHEREFASVWLHLKPTPMRSTWVDIFDMQDINIVDINHSQ